jgi:hypothetical protein
MVHAKWVLHDNAASELICSVTAELSDAAPQVLRLTLCGERIATELYPTFTDAMVRAMAVIEEYVTRGWMLLPAASLSGSQ